LISKKFAPVENPTALVEQFDQIDLNLMSDERVQSSNQYSTRCFNKSVTTLARKIEDLKRIRNSCIRIINEFLQAIAPLGSRFLLFEKGSKLLRVGIW
jgi:hypothetical protein